jgi:phospholipid/cholesterol/gamma-HCH transport system substrate-binding protein
MRARHKRRLPNAVVGLIFLGLVFVAFYYAFTKTLPVPWTGNQYEVKAVFPNAQNLLPKSPVRIAGINVGQVTEVEPLGPSQYGPGAVVVTMKIQDEGRPIHSDAQLKLRPRLFLGGNLFVDLSPGSPSAPEMPDGATFDVNHTSGSVQLDQILTTLQSDVRGNLQLLLRELGTGLESGGARGLRTLYADSVPAFRYGSQLNEALLGTHPHDLSNLIRDLDRVTGALHRYPPQLSGLLHNMRLVTGAFAAQDTALQNSIAELPQVIDTARPALASLNASLPYVRALARESLPGVRNATPALEAANPLLVQLAAWLSPSEAGGLARELREATPVLARLSRRLPAFLEQGRAAGSCFNNVVLPWSQDTVPDPYEPSPGEVHQELGYALPGIGGISRSADANGQYARAAPSGGQQTVTFPPVIQGRDTLAGVTPYAIEGTLPGIRSSARTPYRPGVPCETQERPNLASQLGPAPQQKSAAGAMSGGMAQTLMSLSRAYAKQLMVDAVLPPAKRRADVRSLVRRLDPIRERYLKAVAGLGLDDLARQAGNSADLARLLGGKK